MNALTEKEQKFLIENDLPFKCESMAISEMDLNRLRGPQAWINSEIMDAFGVVVNKRNKKRMVELSISIRVHVFPRHFLTKTTGSQTQYKYEYEKVKKWLVRSNWGIGNVGLLMFPYLADHHWTLIVAYLRNEMFSMYDSFNNIKQQVTSALNVVRKYVVDEINSCPGLQRSFKSSIGNWVVCNKAGYPSQKDGGSCGIFVLWVIEHLERCAVPSFRQEDILLLRQKTELLLRGREVVTLAALGPSWYGRSIHKEENEGRNDKTCMSNPQSDVQPQTKPVPGVEDWHETPIPNALVGEKSVSQGAGIDDALAEPGVDEVVEEENSDAVAEDNKDAGKRKEGKGKSAENNLSCVEIEGNNVEREIKIIDGEGAQDEERGIEEAEKVVEDGDRDAKYTVYEHPRLNAEGLESLAREGSDHAKDNGEKDGDAMDSADGEKVDDENGYSGEGVVDAKDGGGSKPRTRKRFKPTAPPMRVLPRRERRVPRCLLQ